jgi:molybdopterin-containing oxidoreductase family iron-sulfur binding subunit
MSKAKQCPSTNGKKTLPEATPLMREPATGRAHWRSLEEISQTDRFREFAEREFPALASELTGDSRRHFLKVMGASIALAGAGTIPGCRRPDHKILPYTESPEFVIPGRPTFYASTMPLPSGGAEGVLVQTYSGRPTKIEGNPLHPMTRGASSLRAQASVLEVYDPDRLVAPTLRSDGPERRPGTWADFDRVAGQRLAAHEASGGEGLVFVVDQSTSPTRARLRDQIRERFPQAMWVAYEAIDRENEKRGTEIAFGEPKRARLKLGNAMRIVSLDGDFLGGEESNVDVQRGFGASRHVAKWDDEMNRLYVFETGLTATGMTADHRKRLRPSQVTEYAKALAQAVLARTGGAPEALSALSAAEANLEGIEPVWIDAVADDLVEHRGRCVVTAGASQPPAVHALVAAMNEALGAIGATIEYRELPHDAAGFSAESLSDLARAARAGGITTLICLEKNPLFDAPADVREALAEAWPEIEFTATLAHEPNETAAASLWALNSAHWLESWGDAIAWDGTLSPIQPMIKPIFNGRSTIEVLGGLLGGRPADGYELVRETWRDLLRGDFETQWRRALHDGLVAGSGSDGSRRRVRGPQVARAVVALSPRPAGEGLEAVFIADPRVWDGRHANNGWLQEIPDAVTKVTWDNPVLVSPATALKLGLDGWLDRIGEQRAPVARVVVGERAFEAPVWRVPGMADDAVVIPVGGGRRVSGLVGTGAGVDAFAVRPSGADRVRAGVRIEGVGRTMPIACTQDHGVMRSSDNRDDRPILREFDKQAFEKHGREKKLYKGPYKRTGEMNMAKQLGTEAHTPVPESIYQPDQRHDYSTGMQWGMSIDLNSCIGCNVCTIACQAENNIPVVGKTEVNMGREMHWIRVDRYFLSQPAPDEESGFGDDFGAAPMPVACVHCENAPCEAVCPVNATVHSPDGLNVMSYNRCIGTRYCSNNCPYKVRRFNFFDYATKRMTGEKPLGGLLPNEHWIPPRLREDNPELRQMANNPNVTVRERGVMEKCTYCIQRINNARIDYVRLQGLERVPDGALKTACQQACPTEAIVFGDINDPTSKVTAARDSTRTYALLDYLNTKPRTTYEARLRNPNPAIRPPVLEPGKHHGSDHDGGYDEEHARRDPGHIMSLSVLDPGAMTTGGRA